MLDGNTLIVGIQPCHYQHTSHELPRLQTHKVMPTNSSSNASSNANSSSNASMQCPAHLLEGSLTDSPRNKEGC